MHIKTTTIGFIYRDFSHSKLLPERLYGSQADILQKFGRMQKDFKSIDLEILDCPVEYTRWSKAIDDFEKQEYEDSKVGIDYQSLDDLEKQLPF